MEPTIGHGSMVTVDHDAYLDRKPERFDIVAFIPTIDQDAVFLFRVIGLPGESVEIDQHGVSIEGKEIAIPRGAHYKPGSGDIVGGKTYNTISLKNEDYFVMGDNGSNANDSRYLGPIEESAIIGKVTKIEQGGARQPATRPESKAE